jgi:superfamily II DNA or RNA helicase
MTTNVIVDSVYSRIDTHLSAEVANEINDNLRYHPDGYQHTWKYQHKQWDGYTYLFNVVRQDFRTGLLKRVLKLLDRLKVDYTVVDNRSKQENLIHLSKMSFGDINPYPFQTSAAEATLEESHGIIASPTGTGKTVIMGLLVKLHHTRTLIVVNSRVLLDQTYEFFDSVVPGGVGIIGSGDFEIKDVTIATIQSLASILGIGKKQDATYKAPDLLDYIKTVGLVVHDEVHEADSNSVDGLYTKMEAHRFVGMTATPYSWAFATEKGKNLEMEQHFGVKVYDSRETTDFIKLGLTVPLYVTRPIMPTAKEFEGYEPNDKSLGEYKATVDAQVVNNDERTKEIAKHVEGMVKSGNSCYVFYNRIAYGEKLCEAMGNLDPVMLQGSTPRDKRNQIFKDVDSKKQLLVVSDIGSYGLNIKSLNSIVIASPTKDARQLKGRVCRAAKGKACGIVIDPVDWAPYLYRHSELRENQYKRDGDTVVG